MPTKRRSDRQPPGARRPAARPAPPELPVMTGEVEAAPGLERIAASELRRRFEQRVEVTAIRPGAVAFELVGNPYQLLKLEMAQAVYSTQRFAIPRPKALLGDQHFRALLEQIAAARALHPAEAFQTLTINAAGADSPVLRRLRDELAARAGLTAAPEGDLLLRLRHPPDDETAWEALVRLSPRPLATRPWRVCNYEGALNAAVARAMVFLTQPKPEEAYLNLCCGSGTLLIERCAAAEAAAIAGYDVDEGALDCARRNIEAAGYSARIGLRLGDCTALPLPDKSQDAITADLPFGSLVGSHQENRTLYPALLDEAARLLKPGGRCVLISHELRLMDSLLDDARAWAAEQIIPVTLGGLHPRIYVLVRR